jgi:hypothetical protein
MVFWEKGLLPGERIRAGRGRLGIASQDLNIVILHEDWLAAPSLSQEGQSGN